VAGLKTALKTAQADLVARIKASAREGVARPELEARLSTIMATLIQKGK
jgi:hypothetical protein